jgi:predicted cupin superfamily sugar epimerase
LDCVQYKVSHVSHVILPFLETSASDGLSLVRKEDQSKTKTILTMASIAFLIHALTPLADAVRGDSGSRHDRNNRHHDHRHSISGRRRTVQEIISHLNLVPTTDEKGSFLEAFRDADTVNHSRPAGGSGVYYLLEGSAGPSAWHRSGAVEVWQYYAGAPLTLSLSKGEGEAVRDVQLGPDAFHGEQPQVAIGKSEWQSARSLGDWTLVWATGKNDVPRLRLLLESCVWLVRKEFAKSGVCRVF